MKTKRLIERLNNFKWSEKGTIRFIRADKKEELKKEDGDYYVVSSHNIVFEFKVTHFVKMSVNLSKINDSRFNDNHPLELNYHYTSPQLWLLYEGEYVRSASVFSLLFDSEEEFYTASTAFKNMLARVIKDIEIDGWL